MKIQLETIQLDMKLVGVDVEVPSCAATMDELGHTARGKLIDH